MDQDKIHMLIEQIKLELNENILSFWVKYGLDDVHGGFIGRMHNNRQIQTQAPKGLILNSRLLWTFSAAYRVTQNKLYLDIAQLAYQYLNANFFDTEFGGYYWMLDYQGNALDDKKKIYGQAFSLYALSEYYRAHPDPEILKQAEQLFGLIEEHSFDKQYGGYFEAYERNWALAEDLRLSDIDMNEKKSMNTHLHILEAYTNLFRVWPSELVGQRIELLLNLFAEHIIDSESSHFKLFFDEAWHSKTNRISYGHDIEGSWLLYEAAEVLGQDELKTTFGQWALRMAEAVLQEGIQPDGSIVYEKGPGNHVDTDRHWWPQAESAVGFLNAYQLSGDEAYLGASQKAWSYILAQIVDHEYGEWVWRVNEEGRLYQEDWKVSEWKGPYHNARACMELMHRYQALLKQDNKTPVVQN